jgi:hypothetical protein
MKRIAYSFLLLFVMSCSSAPSSSSNRIVIEFRDSVIRDFYLLAVRDSALVVAPYTTDYSSIDSLVAEAHTVTFRKVEHLYKNSSPSLGDELWAGTTGFALAGCLSAIPYIFDYGSGDGHPGRYNVGIPIGGFAAGLILGLVLNYTYSERFLDSKEHLELIKKRAFYKNGEPPELKLVH